MFLFAEALLAAEFSPRETTERSQPGRCEDALPAAPSIRVHAALADIQTRVYQGSPSWTAAPSAPPIPCLFVPAADSQQESLRRPNICPSPAGRDETCATDKDLQ